MGTLKADERTAQTHGFPGLGAAGPFPFGALREVAREDGNKKPRIRGVASVVQQAATRLRDEMTPAESRLREELRAKRLRGLRFGAPHPVGPFILDFYCPVCKTAVELDGSAHDDQQEQDAAWAARNGHWWGAWR